MAYQAQSASLRYVQQFGPELERTIQAFLAAEPGWTHGDVIYHQEGPTKYKMQVDAYWPVSSQPRAFVSTTYCSPDKPGHSNENKLQLKLGELLLLKANYPDITSTLVIGGNQNTWLPYVLQVFQFFYDNVIFMWERNSESQLKLVREHPDGVPLKHHHLWESLRQEWHSKNLRISEPVFSRLRLRTWELMRTTGCEGDLPSDISNSIVRRCMESAYAVSLKTGGKVGKEWTHYANEDWERLWQSRSFFNPSEAAVQLTIEQMGAAHLGGLATDVAVPSMLHSLPGRDVQRTKVREDFVLFSKKFGKPVFVQCKASGGGKSHHGKNVQNRTKEQVSRSLIYRGHISDQGHVSLRPQDYIWIGILDGNWGVGKRQPLKYMNMLQWAGYQYLLGADSLVDSSGELLPSSENPLVDILSNLDCYTDRQQFEQDWRRWGEERAALFDYELDEPSFEEVLALDDEED